MSWFSPVRLDIMRTTPQPRLPVGTTAAVVPRLLLLAVDGEHCSLSGHASLMHHFLQHQGRSSLCCT